MSHNGEPVNKHLLSPCLGEKVFPKRVGKDEDHGDYKTVDGRRLHHGHAHEEGPGDGIGGVIVPNSLYGFMMLHAFAIRRG